MACSSDSAVDALRSTEGLRDSVLRCSSYAPIERTRRWLRYPGEMVKSVWQKAKSGDSATTRRRPFIEATSLKNDLNGKVRGTANQILAAMGYNEWVPKIPGQKGLRILCLDGGGSRGMTSVIAVNEMVKAMGGVEVADCFDLVVGTSTGAIIAFLIGLKRESSEKAVDRYDVLIPAIFTKPALSTPLLLFTTATYDEAPFMTVLSDILGDTTSMLDSRADPTVPYVFAVTSKMSSTPTHVALFRNYNYNGGELPDPFVVKPEEARETLGLSLKDEDQQIQSTDYPKRPEQSGGAPWRRQQDGSRHPGSCRVLQRYALRASTAAPTVFKPVLMGGEMYCDGGIVASNPTAIGIHEARTLFPDVPIELVVSIGTGGFKERKSAPRIGWDGIIGQIVDSACDGEQIHHILEDILGEGGTMVKRSSSISNTQYVRFNPILGFPDEFPIDITDPKKLELIKQITRDYMNMPEQKRRLEELADLLQGREGFRKRFRRKS
jgi:calcium-independent phospholipase A2-gamma